MFPITFLMSCPSAFVVCRSDCTTSLSNPGVRPLHIPFQCVSSVLFYSAWTVAKHFLLGFLSLKVDPPLLYSIPGCPGQCLMSKPRAHSIFLLWMWSVSWLTQWCLTWKALVVCASPSLAVPSFAWKPGYRERRKEGEAQLLLAPVPSVSWQQCCRLGDGGTWGAQRNYTKEDNKRDREWETDLTGTGQGENAAWAKGWTQWNEGRKDGRMKANQCNLTHSLSG